jgi:hypothetical protein
VGSLRIFEAGDPGVKYQWSHFYAPFAKVGE